MATPYTPAHEAHLAQARTQYRRLAEVPGSRLSLTMFTDFEGFSIEAYCRDFAPNPRYAAAARVVETFMHEYGLRLGAQSANAMSSAGYMYPTTDLRQLVRIGQNLSVDWALNDTIGRDRFAALAPGARREAEDLVRRMTHLGDDLRPPRDATPLEHANCRALAEIRSTADGAWFAGFREDWDRHVAVTHQDRNARALGEVPTVEEYVDARADYGGMRHHSRLVEYATGRYIDWAEARAAGIDEQLHRIRDLSAGLTGALNDPFSVEKEFLDAGSDANLVIVCLLNNPGCTIVEAVHEAARATRTLVAEFFALAAAIRDAARGHARLAACVEANLRGMAAHLRTTWTWQLGSPRYRRPASMFTELATG